MNEARAKMDLSALIEGAARFDRSLLILVPKDAELRPSTKVMLQESEWPPLPVPDGMRVMFNVETLTHVLVAWNRYSRGGVPTHEEAAKALEHYDKYDAFIDPVGQVGS